jgi:orotidine-5'-phosphate decarboxylase
MTPFADRLAEAVRGTGNPLCVGLDPRWESLPGELRARFGAESLDAVAAAIEVFCLRVLDLVAGRVGVVKPQSAFFEACGPAGLAALRSVVRRAKDLGLLIILDSKRGDIASTAAAYADAAFGGTAISNRRFPVWAADAITVNPYLGLDAVEPFISAARQVGGGVFVLVRTSNPGAGRTSIVLARRCTATSPPLSPTGTRVVSGPAGSVTSVRSSVRRIPRNSPNCVPSCQVSGSSFPVMVRRAPRRVMWPGPFGPTGWGQSSTVRAASPSRFTRTNLDGKPPSQRQPIAPLPN